MGRKKRKPEGKIPRTLRFLTPPPSAEHLLSLPMSAAPKGRLWVPRLSLTRHPKVVCDAKQISQIIAHSHNRNVDWFPDANIFLAPTAQEIWESLFATANVVLAHPVHEEILTWMRDPCANEFAHGVLSKCKEQQDGPVRALAVGTEPKQVFLLHYYVQLLGVRKRASDFGRPQLGAKLGREPTNQELSNWCKDTLGPRGQLMALSGERAKTPKNRLNDEVLIVLAILNAIVGGRETVILTRDEGIYEQFYKAMWLLDEQYRSMLMAEAYAQDPFRFPVQRVRGEQADLFDGEVGLLQKPSALLHELLPKEHDSVSFHCLYLHEGTCTHVSFCAERQMRKLLKAKIESRGLNTTCLDGANCHVELGPLAPKWQNFAVIGRDHAVTIQSPTPMALSMVDVHLALNNVERYIAFRTTEIAGFSDFSF